MKRALVITSIYSPNQALKRFAESALKNAIDFYLIGDVKTPKDFSLKECKFYSLTDQAKLPFALSGLLPHNSYTRKNIGYLLAIKNGAEIIFESDDDNFPLDIFFQEKNLNPNAYVLRNKNWVNIYKYFTSENIWPRGFPLDHIKNAIPEISTLEKKSVRCPIQQGLADENPDVDAIYRLTQSLPIYFQGKDDFAVGNGTYCPFNTQSTLFFKEAFPLMYLPSTCNARLTDIWRGLIATRVAWTNDWYILFTKPTVYQERNAHDLMHDFKLEMDLYLHNAKLCEYLNNLDLKSGVNYIEKNMLSCYQKMIELKLIQKEELHLLDAWFNDISRYQERLSQAFENEYTTV